MSVCDMAALFYSRRLCAATRSISRRVYVCFREFLQPPPWRKYAESDKRRWRVMWLASSLNPPCGSQQQQPSQRCNQNQYPNKCHLSKVNACSPCTISAPLLRTILSTAKTTPEKVKKKYFLWLFFLCLVVWALSYIYFPPSPTH